MKIIGHSVGYLLPGKLENFIFNDLLKNFQGKLPDYKDAKNQVDADETKVKGCLAKYFAMSFKEANQICQYLLSIETIKEIFKNKENINILDIGSGSGGNSIGLLYCLKKKGILDNNKVKVISIDGNEKALEYQEQMIKNKIFFPDVSLIKKPIIFKDRGNFQDEMNEIVSGNEFDIIMSFQFVNELYRNRKKYKEFRPLYRTMAELAYRYLKKDGLFILSDVNDKEKSLPYPYHFSQLMNSEIITYLHEEKETGLRCIIPLSCAFWYKECWNLNRDKANCFQQEFFNVHYKNEGWFKDRGEEIKPIFKFVYKVFAHKNLADKILSQFEKKDIYKVSKGGKEKKFCDKGEPKSTKSNLSAEKQRNAPDAFALSSLLK